MKENKFGAHNWKTRLPKYLPPIFDVEATNVVLAFKKVSHMWTLSKLIRLHFYTTCISQSTTKAPHTVGSYLPPHFPLWKFCHHDYTPHHLSASTHYLNKYLTSRKHPHGVMMNTEQLLWLFQDNWLPTQSNSISNSNKPIENYLLRTWYILHKYWWHIYVYSVYV